MFLFNVTWLAGRSCRGEIVTLLKVYLIRKHREILNLIILSCVSRIERWSKHWKLWTKRTQRLEERRNERPTNYLPLPNGSIIGSLCKTFYFYFPEIS